MISLALSRVTTSDIARPTSAPVDGGGERGERRAAGRGRDLHRDERAGQHHRFEAEIDEAADAIDEAADGRQQDRRRHQHRGVEEGSITSDALRSSLAELRDGEDHDGALQDLDDLDRARR